MDTNPSPGYLPLGYLPQIHTPWIPTREAYPSGYLHRGYLLLPLIPGYWIPTPPPQIPAPYGLWDTYSPLKYLPPQIPTPSPRYLPPPDTYHQYLDTYPLWDTYLPLGYLPQIPTPLDTYPLPWIPTPSGYHGYLHSRHTYTPWKVPRTRNTYPQNRLPPRSPRGQND